MIYEVINPSDCVTLECDNVAIAGIVCLLLGSGQYGLECEDEKMNVPLFMFGGFEEWWKEQNTGMELNAFIDSNAVQIAAVLHTCLCMGRAERHSVVLAGEHMTPDAFTEYKLKINDKNRSSMNDICGRAYKIAEKLLTKQKDLPKAPQQVFRSAI